MTQMKRLRGVFATAGLLAGLAFAGIPAFAQTSAPAPEVGRAKGMIPGGEAMKPGMMMDPATRQKMSGMMDNCNRMMESMTPKDGVTTPPVPNKG
jgi:hypothetical protein